MTEGIQLNVTCKGVNPINLPLYLYTEANPKYHAGFILGNTGQSYILRQPRFSAGNTGD